LGSEKKGKGKRKEKKEKKTISQQMSTRGGQKDGWGDSLRLTIDHALLFESLRAIEVLY